VQRIASRQTDASQENRRAQVREVIGQRKLEEEWTRYQRDMRNEAYVDLRLDAAPAGSSPAPAATTPANVAPADGQATATPDSGD
jgi:peptidyl-prolyl cis-trans isomerase SurA